MTEIAAEAACVTDWFAHPDPQRDSRWWGWGARTHEGWWFRADGMLICISGHTPVTLNQGFVRAVSRPWWAGPSALDVEEGL